MSAASLAVLATGLVTPVGLSAGSSCAAFRAKLTNPGPTRFLGSDGEWIMAHEVPLEAAWRGIPKLVKMAAMAVAEALQEVPRASWSRLPLLLCVAEPRRPGRAQGLEDRVFAGLQSELGAKFHPSSGLVARGRVGVGVALSMARQLLREGGFAQVLIVAADSLVSGPTLVHYERELRVLTAGNSDGFMPGEGAGAVLVGVPQGQGELVVSGLGFGVEPAGIQSTEPLRADGLSSAINAALADAGLTLRDLDFRITDLSGEQYYFKEASLALSRTLRNARGEFDVWHPAECTGEAGAAAGASVLALAHAACRDGYARGPGVLAHFSADDGQRAAIVCQWSPKV